MLNKNFLSTTTIIFILAILVIMFFRNVLFFHGDYIIQGGDLVQTYYSKLFYKESLLKWRLPFWNPYIYSGYPFLAHSYHGIFYPFNLLFLMMPINIGYSWIQALHVFLAGLFMFLLVKYLVKDKWAAFASASAFMFSGFTVNRIWAGHFELYATSIWIPLVFLFFLKTLERKSVLFSIFTGASLAIQFFAGHNQTSFFTILILTIYTVFFCFDDIVFCIKSLLKITNRNKLPHQTSGASAAFKNIITVLFLFTSTLFFFVVFSAIQLFPTLELMNLSTRAEGIPFFMSAYGSFPPDHLIRFLIPNFFGNFLKTLYAGNSILGEIHWEFTYYIGIIPLFMAIYSIYASLNEKTKRTLILIILVVFMISGLTRFIFLQLWKIRNNPDYSNPATAFIVQFFERIYTGELSMFRIIPLFIIFLICALLFFGYVKRKTIDSLKSTYDNDKMILFFAVLSIVGIILAFGHYSGGLYHFLYKFFPGYNKFKWPSRHLIITNFSLCILAGYCMMRLKTKNYIKLTLIVLILLDLFIYGNQYLYLKNLNEFFPDQRIVNLLRAEKQPYRMLTLPVLKPSCLYEPSCAEFQANACIPLHLYNIGGYDPLILKRYHEFTNIIQNLSIDYFGNTSIKIENLSNINLMKSLNVKYIFVGNNYNSYKLNLENFKIVEKSRRGNLLRFKSYLPRFMFVRDALVATSDKDLINRLLSKDFTPERYVLLEAWQSPIIVDNIVDSNNSYQIDIINYSPDQIGLELTTGSKGYLTSSEVYYPGWKAFINGKETKIYRSNYAFRSIFIPSAGNYKIQFRFESGSLKKGELITLLALCIVSIYCILYSNKRIRNKLKLR